LQRGEGISRELEQIEARRTGEELGQLREAMAAAEADVQRGNGELETRKQTLAVAEAAQREATSELDRQRQAMSAARGRLASLEALQHAALGEDRRDVAGWLRQHGLADAPRLGALLSVEPGWEAAVETALGMAIEAIVVEGALARDLSLDQLPKGVLTLADPTAAVVPAAAGTLAAKVQGPAVVGAWLGAIRCAADLAEARAMAAALAPHESVISRDGHWLGPGWRRIDRGRQGHEGVIERGREIEALKQKRLEPVNLAAIQEYGRAAQRKDLPRRPERRPDLRRWRRSRTRSARSTARPAAASRTPSTASMPACRSCSRACSAAATPTWN
jgi:chromosome segregation protein